MTAETRMTRALRWVVAFASVIAICVVLSAWGLLKAVGVL